jgi:hypothetical protein
LELLVALEELLWWPKGLLLLALKPLLHKTPLEPRETRPLLHSPCSKGLHARPRLPLVLTLDVGLHKDDPGLLLLHHPMLSHLAPTPPPLTPTPSLALKALAPVLLLGTWDAHSFLNEAPTRRHPHYLLLPTPTSTCSKPLGSLLLLLLVASLLLHPALETWLDHACTSPLHATTAPACCSSPIAPAPTCPHALATSDLCSVCQLRLLHAFCQQSCLPLPASLLSLSWLIAALLLPARVLLLVGLVATWLQVKLDAIVARASLGASCLWINTFAGTNMKRGG